MDMHALIEEIKALLVKIKSGEASQADLEAFVAATNQLNERAIVLRYKAYEASVFERTETASEMNSETPVVSVVEPIIEAVLPEVEKPAEEPSFDLFGLSDEEEEEEEQMQFSLPEEPVVRPEEPIEQKSYFDEIGETLPEASESEPVVETPVQPTATTDFSQNLHPIYEKLHQNDGTLTARLMSVHLDTLKGAFGFNERLQITQELFGGSNEEFNRLIDTIEETGTKEQARVIVSKIANQFNWKNDSQLALELIQKIERKYA